jgi:hypothetical protein
LTLRCLLPCCASAPCQVCVARKLSLLTWHRDDDAICAALGPLRTGTCCSRSARVEAVSGADVYTARQRAAAMQHRLVKDTRCSQRSESDVSSMAAPDAALESRRYAARRLLVQAMRFCRARASASAAPTLALRWRWTRRCLVVACVLLELRVLVRPRAAQRSEASPSCCLLRALSPLPRLPRCARCVCEWLPPAVSVRVRLAGARCARSRCACAAGRTVCHGASGCASSGDVSGTTRARRLRHATRVHAQLRCHRRCSGTARCDALMPSFAQRAACCS